MRLTSLLFIGMLAGCSGENGGPSIAGDAAVEDEGTTADTAKEPEDTGIPAEDAPAAAATFEDVYTKVLKAGTCGGGYCHGGTAGGWSVKTTAAGTYAELVGPSSSACSGLKKVEPGQPEKSSLYLKIRGSFMGVCTGNKMPSGGSVTAAQLEIVRSWIAAGAKP